MKTSKQNTINRQACEWVAKLHESDLSDKERDELKVWMTQSQDHRTEIRRMAERWDELNALTVLAVPTEQQPEKSVSHGKFKFGMATAAVFLVMAVMIWPQVKLDETSMPSSQSYSTDIGEQRLITLPDSSTVLLNTKSQFSVAYSPQYRDIYLVQGEAHFDVASNSERPFRVFAGKSKVRAVGTAFSVYLKKMTVDVTVTHGSVAIDSIRDPAEESLMSIDVESIESRSIVSAGQAAEFDLVAGTIKTITLPEAAHIPAWHHGQLKFSGEPLEQVVEEIARYSPLSIVILDSELRDIRVGGLFDVGETNKMFEALEYGFGIKVEYIDDSLVHLSAATSGTKQL